MDKAKILRLCNEIEDIVSEISKLSENYLIYSDCKSILNRTKAIAVEITAPPKSNADRIRQMTDEELAEMLDIYEVDEICCYCSRRGDQACHNKCYNGIIEWLKQEVIEDGES